MSFINGDWYEDGKVKKYNSDQLDKLAAWIPRLYNSGEKAAERSDNFIQKLRNSNYKLKDISHGIEIWGKG